MSFHIKHKAGFRYEAWCENAFQVVCEADVLVTGDEIFVDNIRTQKDQRRKGYARELIREIQVRLGRPVKPIGILDTPEARGFWASLGLEDALGAIRT